MSNTRKIYRVSKAGASRGVGGASREAAAIYAEDKVIRFAKNTSDKMDQKRGAAKQDTAPKKKMTGIFFYIILSITLLDDILDIVLDATLLLSILTSLTSLLTLFIVFVYLYQQKVNMDTRKIVTWVLSFVVEIVFFLSWMPMSSISLILTRIMENNQKIKAMTSKFQANKNITRLKR